MTPQAPRNRAGRLVAVLLLALALPAAGQVNNPAYANYFLVGQFGEICTMCEVVVLCDASAEPPAYPQIPEQQSFTLYHLHTRTFLSQVSTIWEWFISNFSSAGLEAGHTRPVTVYAVDNGAWGAPVTTEIRVALDPPLLTIGDDHQVDRTNRSWSRTSTKESLGHCQRMPLWDSLATIKAHHPGAGQ